jgi:hypothetical protein
VPRLFRADGGGPLGAGGIVGYPLERIYEEVAYLAYHLGWSAGTMLEMEHSDRLKWVEEVSAINRRLAEPTGGR